MGGSPADCAGLKTGDYLMVVNGLNVSNASHDDVVRLVGSSLESLTLEIAENYNSSDSSEDELQSQLRPKSKYQNQRGKRIQGRKERRCDTSDPVVTAAVGAERRSRFGGLHPETKDPEDFRSGWQRVEPTERSSSAAPLKYRGQQQRPKHTIITRERRLGIPKNSRQCGDVDGGGPRIATASITSLRSSQDAFVPVRATTERPPLGHRHPTNGLQLEAIRAMVGYVGSIEMPALARPPSWRTQSLKGAVRRLRIEQKIHPPVLMCVNGDGVHLVNASGQTIAQYPADNIVSCGVCPDDKRFFGLMTLHRSDDDCAGQSALLGSSCHVFSIDPQLNRHSTHIQKARSFNVKCSMNPTTHCCAEFPASATLILRTISRLCCNHDDVLDDADIAQMELSDDPTSNRYLSNSSASDSGLGRVGKAAVGNKVYVVEMPIETNLSKSDTTSRSSLQSTKYSCSNAKNAVRVSLATNTCAAENSDVFYDCSDPHRGGSYAQRPDSGVQPHSKRSRPIEATRSHVQVAVQKALSATRHPVETDIVKPRHYHNVSMPPPPPLPARQPRGSARKTNDSLSVAARKPLTTTTINTLHSHSTSRIAQLSRPKSTPPVAANDWEGMADVADYESDPCDSFTTGRSDASVVSTTLPRTRRSRQFAGDVNHINEKVCRNL